MISFRLSVALLLLSMVGLNAQNEPSQIEIEWSEPLSGYRRVPVGQLGNYCYYIGYESLKMISFKKDNSLYSRINLETFKEDTIFFFPRSDYNRRTYNMSTHIVKDRIDEYYIKWRGKEDLWEVIVNSVSFRPHVLPKEFSLFKTLPDMDEADGPEMTWSENDSLMIIWSLSSKDKKKSNAFIDYGVFDKSFNKVDQGIIQLNYQFEDVRIYEIDILNNGQVAVLYRYHDPELLRKEEYFNRTWSSRLKVFDRTDISPDEILIDDDRNSVTSCSLFCDPNSDSVLIAGLFRDRKSAEMTGHFTMYGIADELRSDMIISHPLDSTKKDYLLYKESLEGSDFADCLYLDNKFYLLFEKREISLGTTDHRNAITQYFFWKQDLTLFSHNKNGVLNWSSTIPKTNVNAQPYLYSSNSMDSKNLGSYILGYDKKNIVFTFLDHEKNIQNRIEGKKLKTLDGIKKSVIATVSVDAESGESHYSVHSTDAYEDEYPFVPYTIKNYSSGNTPLIQTNKKIKKGGGLYKIGRVQYKKPLN